MVKKRGKANPKAIKKLLTIGAVLVVAQGVFIYFFSDSGAPKSASDAISRAVENRGLTGSKAAQAKVQSAIMAFKSKNKRFPNSLTELVPEYLEKVPVDPATSKPIEYALKNGKPVVGSPSSTMYASNDLVKSGETTITRNEQEALIASLSDNSTKASYVYSSEGKRDPFLPFDFMPKVKAGATPLERYTFDQLKVSAILMGGNEPVAMIDDSTGKSHPVRKGTKVGPMGGEVVDIQPNMVIVIESEEDFTGEKRSRTIELPLRRAQPASR